MGQGIRLVWIYDARASSSPNAALLCDFFELRTERIHAPGAQVASERDNLQTKRVDTRLIQTNSELSDVPPSRRFRRARQQSAAGALPREIAIRLRLRSAYRSPGR